MSVHDELSALLQRYGRACDERAIDVLASLFRDDAVMTGALGTLGKPEWLETMKAERAFPVSQHMIGVPLVELGDDGLSATMDTYAVVYQCQAPGDAGPAITLGIRYLDQVANEDGQWVFVRRNATTLWMN